MTGAIDTRRSARCRSVQRWVVEALASRGTPVACAETDE
jgi:hypothetical protein